MIGFEIESNTDDKIVFSDGRRLIEIGLERYYPLSLTFGLVDSDGSKRALALLEEALDPAMTLEIRRQITTLVEKLNLDKKSNAQLISDGSLFQYVCLEIHLALDFLTAHRAEIFDMPDGVRTRYDQARNVSFARVGFKTNSNS